MEADAGVAPAIDRESGSVRVDSVTSRDVGREVAVRDLSIRFKTGVQATEGVSFHVEPGEFVSIIGPSGCGKSTVLNAVASLLPSEATEVTGEISVGDRHVSPYDDDKTVDGLGYVFQRDALMPWRTVRDNILTGLEIRRATREERNETVAELIEMVHLSGFEDYYPHQISGGMRQRTSLARTLAYNPSVILMDEPFGALDAQTRMTLQTELIRIWSEHAKTILFVTHDLSEAILLGQRVIGFSRQPGTIIRDFDVPFAHPRDPYELYGSTEFADYQTEVWRQISDEFREDDDSPLSQ